LNASLFFIKKETDLFMETLANQIKEFLIANNLWSGVRIYFNGKAYCSSDGMISSIDPSNYFSYVNPETLSMSFDGPLYTILNQGDDLVCSTWETYNALTLIFSNHGYYFEFGNAWNLTLFPTGDPIVELITI
jgi:hypothetical protein